jgi:hypothetical protein
MNYETRIKTILSILSKDREKRYNPRDGDRNCELHFLENLDWYYIPPTEMFRREIYVYTLFDSDGVPTHDADGNKLDVSVIQQLRKEWEWQKELSEKLEKLALQYMQY